MVGPNIVCSQGDCKGFLCAQTVGKVWIGWSLAEAKNYLHQRVVMKSACHLQNHELAIRNTPYFSTASRISPDIDLLLRPDEEVLDSNLLEVPDVVTESGDLQVLQPFVQRRLPLAAQHFTTNQRLPQVLEETLSQAVAKRPYGIIALVITPGYTQ